VRRIAHALGLSRNTVSQALADVQAQRGGTTVPPPRRPSLLDPYEPALQELLGRYPDLTVQRLLEELRNRGFTGGCTIVRQRLRELRPRSARSPVIRFETAPGAQGQMD
jgi:transposase